MEAIVHMLYQEKVRAQMVRGDTARNDYVQMRDGVLLFAPPIIPGCLDFGLFERQSGNDDRSH